MTNFRDIENMTNANRSSSSSVSTIKSLKIKREMTILLTKIIRFGVVSEWSNWETSLLLIQIPPRCR